ncbi:MAG: proteasome assembly chaperone family protein [Nitrosopumilaceae archaeon]|nr:proteasome assembly chaperone family protein [Nitrosopumilaceae archaeon]NIU00725.1 proteasome assembly chaperone family protein [Nitrosopumilaceae archaeon]NIU87157.1 proteasome assembly chaperone family protein [Nitrosopumilaceae archaeon]NIV65684.1 proteasome assembly chaperone family protein [Nitrosopumilaceae archaeon]NIX61327.1 proteasome assembly chaperone family protein [Nitrosopumilaceae archaeon]
MSTQKGIRTDFISTPVLNDPVAVCGLPGSGYMGKLAVDYLIEKLNAKKFVYLFCHSFPPQVTINSDGTIDLVKNSLYYCKTDSKDLILLTGDTQPVTAEGEYELVEEIIKICSEMNVQKIITLAAYITGKFSKSPNVYGTATTVEYVKELSNNGILKMGKGNITGMNGVIIGSAKNHGLQGSCILGETSGYVVDAKASKAVLESLSKMLRISIDMAELEKKAKGTEEIIKTLQAQAASQPGQQPLSSSQEKSLGYIS